MHWTSPVFGFYGIYFFSFSASHFVVRTHFIFHMCDIKQQQQLTLMKIIHFENEKTTQQWEKSRYAYIYVLAFCACGSNCHVLADRRRFDEGFYVSNIIYIQECVPISHRARYAVGCCNVSTLHSSALSVYMKFTRKNYIIRYNLKDIKFELMWTIGCGSVPPLCVYVKSIYNGTVNVINEICRIIALHSKITVYNGRLRKQFKNIYYFVVYLLLLKPNRYRMYV